MATYTVTDDVLNSDACADYFTRSDGRLIVGLRAALEILGIPLPVYAIRRKPGRTPAKDMLDAHAADSPTPRPMTLAPVRYARTPADVAMRQIAKAHREGVPAPANLFDQAFPG